jgi:hypothetical protein
MFHDRSYAAFGNSWDDWRCAAISHYSFLEHFKRGDLDAFSFPAYDFNVLAFERWSINFFVFNSSDIHPPLPDDDEACPDLSNMMVFP